MNYSQPSHYRFNEDSLALVDHAVKKAVGMTDLKVLDVGAGCGVIGIEFYKQLKEFIVTVDFIEVQNEFYDHLSVNTEDVKSRVYIESWLNVESLDTDYDLVLSNPPYFFTEDSRPSPSPLRDNCRRIRKEDFYLWLNKACGHLKKSGYFLFSFRDVDEVHLYLEQSRLWSLENSWKKGNCTIFCLKKSFVEYKY